MLFQNDPDLIQWPLHLRSPVEKVYQALSTDAGRTSFWAESAVERDRVIHFMFPNGQTWQAPILEAHPPYQYMVNISGVRLPLFLWQRMDKAAQTWF